MDQSSHQYQKGQLTGHIGPQALCCQSLMDKLNDGTIEERSSTPTWYYRKNSYLHAITRSKYQRLLLFSFFRNTVLLVRIMSQ